MPTLFMPTLVMPTLFKSQTLSCHRDSSRALGPKRSILAARYAVALILGANLLVSTASAQDAGDESSTVIYAADYFDIATLTTPEVLAASRDCGSTITTDDIMKYKLRGL